MELAGVAAELGVAASPAFAWAFVGTPFQVVMVRMQSSSAYPNIWTCVRKTAGEGVFVFWRGFRPALLNSVPYSTTLFGTYRALAPPEELRDQRGAAGRFYAWTFAAGCGAGLACLSFAQPLDVWRARLQISGDPAAVLPALRRSPSLLLRGLPLNAALNVGGNGTFFVLAALFSQALDSSPSALSVPRSLKEPAVGGLAGMVFNFLWFPCDVVRTRLMVSSDKTARGVALEVWREGRIPAFWRGSSIVVARAFFQNSLGFYFLHASRRFFAADTS